MPTAIPAKAGSCASESWPRGMREMRSPGTRDTSFSPKIDVVTDSIVLANGAGTQVSSTCQQQRIVSSGITLDPSYTAATMAGDPKLISDPSNLCIDQGLVDANKTVKDDYFGSARPQGGGYDIGFQEVR